MQDHKFVKTDFTIKDMARQLNLTTEGVRYYEKQGIVKFNRNEINGHSMFRSRCVTVLRFVRMYNAMGIPLSDIGKLLNIDDGDLGEMGDRLKPLEEQQKRKIWWESRMLDRIREQADYVRGIAETCPLLFLDCLRSYMFCDMAAAGTCAKIPCSPGRFKSGRT